MNKEFTQCRARSTPAARFRVWEHLEGNGILHGNGAPEGSWSPNDGRRNVLFDEHFKALANRPKAEEQLPDAILSINLYKG